MKKGVIIGGAIVIFVVAIIAGAFVGPQIPFVSNLTGGGSSAQGGFAGGPMGQLSDAERQQLQNMSDSERQQFFQKKLGTSGPGGMPQGAQGAGFRGNRSMTIEGEIADVASDSLTVKTTDGGSRTIYTDGKTTIAYAKGVAQVDLATGDKIIAIATPEANNVITATTIVVK